MTGDSGIKKGLGFGFGCIAAIVIGILAVPIGCFTLMTIGFISNSVNEKTPISLSQASQTFINARSGPGLGHDVLFQIQYGQKIKILAKKEIKKDGFVWISISNKNGEEAWAAGKLVIQKTKPEWPDSYSWELVGRQGPAGRLVFVSSEGIKDRKYIAWILLSIVEKKSQIYMVFFFDSKDHTPRNLPMKDHEMLHLKAQYNWNPNTKFEEFKWISIANRNTSPPEIKGFISAIRPGYFE